MDEPDIVVPVREGGSNEWLRYALRSWARNLPHRRVWLVGYRPPWAAGVEHLSMRQTGTKYRNTTEAVRVACEHPGVSRVFLLANDDMFVMRPVIEMPVLHRGPVAEAERYYATRAQGRYLRGLRETRDLLVSLGHDEPLSYELHVPLPVAKAGMLTALDVGAHLDVVHKRTLYGVLRGIGGDRVVDVKVITRGGGFDRASPFLSTMPDTFLHGQVGQFIRSRFPEPGPYERQGRR